MNYYNEFDKRAAEWLRNLIAAGLIPAGVVDERDIREVKPDDIAGYTQCHFFAGIGGWPLALQLAGWPADREIWTGSCPCQPFSSAGKKKGTTDKRHLWPDWYRLIRARRPAVLSGEQVGSKIALSEWFPRVCYDLEEIEYRVPKDEAGNWEAYSIPACSVGTPHIRQRLWWPADRVADANGSERERRSSAIQGSGLLFHAANGGANCGMEHTQGDRWQQWRPEPIGGGIAGGCGAGGLVNSDSAGYGEYGGRISIQSQQPGAERPGDNRRVSHTMQPGRPAIGTEQSGACAGNLPHDFWREAVIIPCADGKARRIKPGLSPLVNGVSGRVAYVRPGHIKTGPALHWYNCVVALKGFGNAIVPELAAEFIGAYMDVMQIARRA